MTNPHIKNINVFSEKVWAEINQTARQRGQPLGDLLAEAIRSYMASEREREDIK